MIVFFNGMGFAFGIFGFLIALCTSFFTTKVSGPYFWIPFGITLFICDLPYRLLAVRTQINENEEIVTIPLWKSLISDAGASLMFIPAWIFGIIWPIFCIWFSKQ